MDIRLVASLVLGGSVFIGIFLSALSFGRQRTSAAKEFACFVLACTIYAGGYFGELWSPDLQSILAWIRVEYFGVAFIPSLWLLFALRYTGHSPSRRLVLLLLGLSLATLLAVLSMDWHSLYYRSPHLDFSGSFPTLAFGRGPLYWIHVSYTWTSIFLGMGLFLSFVSKVPKTFRPQVLLIISCSLLPATANLVYIIGLIPDHIDPTPMTFPFMALPMGLSMFKFRFLDLVPIAGQRVIEALDDAVVVTDASGRIVNANPAASRILGIDAQKTGLPLDRACHANFGLARLVGKEPASMDFASSFGDGPELRFHARAFPVADSKGGHLGTAILVTDVTETVRLVARLDELASTDPLTGLDNRRKFFELAGRELSLVRRTGGLFVACIADLDHFKDVNDSFGHAVGDAVLRAVADCFRSCLRSTDLVCRYGGEEFAVVFPGIDLDEAGLALERLREKIAELVIDAGELPESGSIPGRCPGIRITASFGLAASVPAQEERLEAFFDRADEALYRAKNSGRNKVCRY